MSLRTLSWLVYLSLRFGLGFFLFLMTELSVGLGAFGLLWMVFGHYPCCWLTDRLLVLTVRTLRCPGCGLEYDAVGQWSVGGYTDHRERHILDARSAIDGSQIGHTDCPNCGSTILVR